MNIPNIQQQLYLKKALNEDTDGMFDHPTLDEGSYVHSKKQLKKAVKGSKREIVKAMKRGNKKDAEFWMQNKKDAESQMSESITEGFLRKLNEGSRGTQRLKRIMKSVTKNYEQGEKIIGKQDPDIRMAGFVNPNNAAAKEQSARLSAGVRHMEKKRGLRREINARTRAAAARERGRAGLNPNIPTSTSLSPAIVGGPLGKNINRTGGYEHQENPKRIPKAVQNYRKASAAKAAKGKAK